MTRKLFFAGMLSIVLAFGFMGCDMGNNSKDDEVKGPQSLSGSVAINPDTDVVTGTELTAEYSGDEEVTYQWNKNGTAIADETAETFTPEEEGSYSVTVSLKGYHSKTSTAVAVTAYEGVILTITDVETDLRTAELSIFDSESDVASAEADIVNGSITFKPLDAEGNPWNGTGEYYLQVTIAGEYVYFYTDGEAVFTGDNIELYPVAQRNTIPFDKFGTEPSPSSLKITNMSSEMLALAQVGISFSVVEPGTSLEDAQAYTYEVAWGESIDMYGNSAVSSLIDGDWEPWIGSGTYDVYLILGEYGNFTYYVTRDVSFAPSTETTVDAADFVKAYRSTNTTITVSGFGNFSDFVADVTIGIFDGNHDWYQIDAPIIGYSVFDEDGVLTFELENAEGPMEDTGAGYILLTFWDNGGNRFLSYLYTGNATSPQAGNMTLDGLLGTIDRNSTLTDLGKVVNMANTAGLFTYLPKAPYEDNASFDMSIFSPVNLFFSFN